MSSGCQVRRGESCKAKGRSILHTALYARLTILGGKETEGQHKRWGIILGIPAYLAAMFIGRKDWIVPPVRK